MCCLLPFTHACSVVSMLKSKDCGGEGKFKLIKHFARHPRLKVISLCRSQCSLAAMYECHRHVQVLTRVDYSMWQMQWCASFCVVFVL